MYLYYVISRVCDFLMNSTGMHTTPILHADATLGEKINYQYAYTTGRAGPIPEDITSSLLFARQPVISTTNESFESTENPVDIQQPPPYVIDYWFDHLALSLNSSFPEHRPNATNSRFQFPMFDIITYVS